MDKGISDNMAVFCRVGTKCRDLSQKHNHNPIERVKINVDYEIVYLQMDK